MSEPRAKHRITVMMRFWIVLAVAACRFDFDPLVDAGTSTATSQSGADESIVCIGQSCVVDCSISVTCEVDCGTASACVVQCPATGCTVTACTQPGCQVVCGGDAHAATYAGTTATCP